MLHDELVELAEPVLRKVLEHPFWAGLRDGSAPGEALAHFVQQDSGYLLPAYGRAMAQCAATSADDALSIFFARGAFGALEAKDRLRRSFNELAPQIGLAPLGEQAPIDPLAHAHCSFFRAAANTSLAAAIGALVPMAWFNHNVSQDLAERCTPGSRYEPWIALYQPAPGYAQVVQRYLATADEIAEACSARERRQLVEHCWVSIRYEWTFAESAWRQPSWPV
jgi:thiaminase/transcriptional activator TenA